MDAKSKEPLASSNPLPEVKEGSVGNTQVSIRLKLLARALSVETRGIQRVTGEDRTNNNTHVWNACTFWFSANFAIATLSTRMMGPVMVLSFWDSFAVILAVNLLACILPAWTSVFGLTGLRMTTFSRYSFGYYGNMLVIVLSMVSTTGWNAINSISGASCLAALSDGKMPLWAGVILITSVVWLICAMGITWIHRLDTVSWHLPLSVWCTAAGTGASHFHGGVVQTPAGARGAAMILSYAATIFSFAVSWVNCASDYNVNMPAGTPRSKLFIATYIGITIPAILAESLGAALYSGAQADHSWKLAYAEFGAGGPLAMALAPTGNFGKFLLILAALSSIPNNIPNNYSFAMHAQNFGPWSMRVPRIAWVSVGYIAAVIVGSVASSSFESCLQTFLSIIGDWTIIYIVVMLEEHVNFWRRWSAYDLDSWNTPSLLPFGWAAIGAFLMGFLGATLGMKVTWYVSPIAKLIGGGANVGHELAFEFSAVTFPALRYVERRLKGRWDL